MKYRLTREADAHITDILRTTKNLFGAKQVQIYSKIISDGINLIADEPYRPSTTAREDLRDGVRSLHLELVSKRRHSASHLIYFKEVQDTEGEKEVVILGVLHEHMEPRRRLIQALRSNEDDDPHSPKR
ncbi:type II toxin-antitoxin system RelE/ParE family toxin [Phyllobacterium zundukense]|uniref:Type II toxin-antitoxin system RelE/ParE family toxin n=1 Tax=Phyllobacterium zundukense TaxID=1867719 RepID=A0ACD4D0R9_9HYPH|nr:type II toxin-antitoxin system RelE/ParE family toxin [Phyllobacterium zundukense]UXN59496.1 type II toxin-antitoxin system RelE/ParE family toxin [Phyllobacterium zundukense]